MSGSDVVGAAAVAEWYIQVSVGSEGDAAAVVVFLGFVDVEEDAFTIEVDFVVDDVEF